MNRYVLDSSVVLALLEEEPGADQAAAVLADAYVSAVNMAEVYPKLAERGGDTKQALAHFRAALAGIVPFTDQTAEIAGALRPETRKYGLSLGDRACLARAILLRAHAFTADLAWSALQVPCEIHLLRRTRA